MEAKFKDIKTNFNTRKGDYIKYAGTKIDVPAANDRALRNAPLPIESTYYKDIDYYQFLMDSMDGLERGISGATYNNYEEPEITALKKEGAKITTDFKDKLEKYRVDKDEENKNISKKNTSAALLRSRSLELRSSSLHYLAWILVVFTLVAIIYNRLINK
jgi:hypothetical protein